MVRIDKCRVDDEALGLCIPKKGRVRLIERAFRILIGGESRAGGVDVIHAITHKPLKYSIAEATGGKIYNTYMEAIIPIIEVDERLSEQEKEEVATQFINNLERYATQQIVSMGELIDRR